MCWFRKTIPSAVVAALVAAVAAGAGEPPSPQDKAKSALLLAKAARERERAKAAVLQRVENPAAAFEAAARAKKPLVLWVGIDGPTAKPDVFKRLAACAVQFQVDEYGGSKTPRVVYAGADGTVYSIAEAALTDDAVRVIKQAWVAAAPNLFIAGGLGLLPRPPE